VICDSPAGIERGATLAMRFADAAVIVVNSEVSSVRDSDRIIGLLDSKTVKAEKGERMEKHLLITRFDAARAARGEMLAIEDVLEILSVPLLGIIPESEAVLRDDHPDHASPRAGCRQGQIMTGHGEALPSIRSSASLRTRFRIAPIPKDRTRHQEFGGTVRALGSIHFAYESPG
jgi:hypothetical protein